MNELSKDVKNVSIKGMAGNIPVYCSHDAVLPLAEIVANPRNPNVHPVDQIELLVKIIKKQGWRSPIVISKQSGFVVKGHGRLIAAVDGEMDYAPVDFQDYENEDAEYADMIADNRLAELSNMDPELMADIFEEMDTSLDLTGYTDSEINAILGQLEEMAEEEEEEEGELEPPTYQVIVTCKNEDMMHNLYDRLDVEGFDVEKKIK